MADTDFLPFAIEGGANVVSQDDYEGSAYQLTGFVAGLAKSDQLNKVWRQSAFMAATVANFVIGQTGVDQPDDGNLQFAITNLYNAIAAVAAGVVPSDSVWCGVSAGTPNSQTLTPAPPIDDYHTGTKLYIWQVGPGLTNTGPLQINISGKGLKDVYKVTGAGAVPLTGGEAPVGAIMSARYNGTQLQLASQALGTASTKNTGNTVYDPGTGALEVKAGDNSITVGTDGIRVTSLPAFVGSGRSLAASDNLKTLVATTALTFTVPDVAGFVNGFQCAMFARGGNITLAINGGDAINGGAAGTGAVIPKGFVGYLTADAANAITLELVPCVVSYDSIGSASTTDIGQLSGETGTISGTATVTSLGSTIQPGQKKLIRAGGSFTLVNNSNIVVQAGQNYQCASGDWLLIACIAPGICAVNIMKADGTALVGASTTGNLAQNGWTQFANGLIVQWGFVDFGMNKGEGLYGPYNFPRPFPNACFSIQLTTYTPEVGGGSAAIGDMEAQIPLGMQPTKTQFTIWLNNFFNTTMYARGFYWMAFGY